MLLTNYNYLHIVIVMEYKSKTHLILPFNGTWIVGNGGQDPLKNNHNYPERPKNQLFAYDFKKSHKGNGETLDDYEAFGQEVIAPGSGIVTQVISGSFDLLPGEKDRSVGVGNAVIIDHQNGEASLLAHFKQNSIRVKPGDTVLQGDVLGECGNTGNTSEPHIHYNLQNNPLMHIAEALPAPFAKIIVDGKEEINSEPYRDQHVSNTP